MDHRVKIKAREKLDKCLYLAEELKDLWNLKLTEISVIMGTLGTILKNQEKRNWKNGKSTRELRPSRSVTVKLRSAVIAERTA